MFKLIWFTTVSKLLWLTTCQWRSGSNFFDRLKSTSRGYASLDYAQRFEVSETWISMNVLLNGETVDALAIVRTKTLHSLVVVYWLRRWKSSSLVKCLISRFKQRLVTTSLLVLRWSNNVEHIAKCYGGDISRKKKLLKKQEGKEAYEADR